MARFLEASSFSDGGIEDHLTEGAVMIAFAMHLLRTVDGLRQVAIHPDGEHGKKFDFRGWLEKSGFVLDKPMGQTTYGGVYKSSESHELLVNPKAGQGDVVADSLGQSFVAECKGGILNIVTPANCRASDRDCVKRSAFLSLAVLAHHGACEGKSGFFA